MLYNACQIRHCSPKGGPDEARSHLALNLSLTLKCSAEPKPSGICHYLPPDRTGARSVNWRSVYSRSWGKERLGLSRDLNPIGRCWLSAHLVQCKPDETCRTWTQTWVQARMPDYSLNSAKRSSAIQCCQRHHCLTEGDPAEARIHSALNLSLTLNTALVRSLAANLIFGCCLLCLYSVRYYLPTPPLGQDMTQGQFLSGVKQVWIQ